MALISGIRLLEKRDVARGFRPIVNGRRPVGFIDYLSWISNRDSQVLYESAGDLLLDYNIYSADKNFSFIGGQIPKFRAIIEAEWTPEERELLQVIKYCTSLNESSEFFYRVLEEFPPEGGPYINISKKIEILSTDSSTYQKYSEEPVNKTQLSNNSNLKTPEIICSKNIRTFISCCSKDYEVAEKVYNIIKERYNEVFFAPISLPQNKVSYFDKELVILIKKLNKP